MTCLLYLLKYQCILLVFIVVKFLFYLFLFFTTNAWNVFATVIYCFLEFLFFFYFFCDPFLKFSALGKITTAFPTFSFFKNYYYYFIL